MSQMTRTTRWCPVCEGKGIPVVWGEPSEATMRLADEGRVIVAGCAPVGLHPSHGCACGAAFIASDRVYRREVGGEGIFGIGVWPHGRRPVRVEGHEQGWTIVVAGEGSMLVEERAAGVFFADVFDGMGPWDIEDWVGRRGFEAFVEPRGEGGWEVSIQDPFHLFGLTLVKTWWRALGRDPVEKALGRLADHVVWLPHDGPLSEQPP